MLQHLQSLHLPSILTLSDKSKGTKQPDPNELTLSEEFISNNTNEAMCKVGCFLDFGLGRLAKSPALINVFCSTKDCNEKSESTILHCLTRYLTLQEAEHDDLFNRDRFVSWLCQEWKISALSEVGVYIQSSINDTVFAIKSTLRSKASLLSVHKRRLHQQLSLWENEENEFVESIQRKRRKKQSLASDHDSENNGSLLLEVFNAAEMVQCSESASNVLDTVVSRWIAESTDSINNEQVTRLIIEEAVEECLKSGNKKQDAELSSSITRGRTQLHSSVDTRRNFRNTEINQLEQLGGNGWKEYIAEITNEMLHPIIQHQTIPVGSQASILSNQDIGQLGEGIVYRFLQRSLPSERFSVQWLNQDNESKAAYDFIVEDLRAEAGSTFHHKTFIEVKSSRYEENNVFSISLWEWQFITQLPRVEYHIYRVYGVGDPHKTRITIIKDTHKLLELGRIHLCLSI